MAKRYNFHVKGQLPGSKDFYNQMIVASSIVEAKNKFKSMMPKAKIISCVKGNEVKTPGYNDNKSSKGNNKNNGEGSSFLGTALFGAATMIGGALAAKVFSDKK